MKRLLVVKTSSLGDVVHAFPAVSDALAAGFQVDWVVEEAFADVVALHPGVHQVIKVAWRRWRKNLGSSWEEMKVFRQALQAEHYDLVIDSQGLIKSAIIAGLANGRSAGFSHTSAREPWAAFFYRQHGRVPKGQHAIDRQRQLFSTLLGYPLDGEQDSGLANQGAASNRVMLLHGTTWATKHWPEAMWVDLITRLRAEGLDPVVTWGNDDEEARAQRLVSAGAQALPKTSLAELAKTIAGVRLTISVDSGLGHLSAALGTPTVGLYGPTDGALTGCRGKHVTVLQGDTACAPCLQKRCRRYSGQTLYWNDKEVWPPCFASVHPDSVWRAAQTLLVDSGAMQP